jgi:hypothetical protein
MLETPFIDVFVLVNGGKNVVQTARNGATMIRSTKGQSLLGAVYSLFPEFDCLIEIQSLCCGYVLPLCHQMTSMFAHSGAAVTPHVVMSV